MPNMTPPHHTLDVRGVADLQEELTGRRPKGATIRSYHSRGLMPSQIEPGHWAELEIRDWLLRRRVRPSTNAAAEICDRLAEIATADPDRRDWADVDQLVHQAREINVAWSTIGAALHVSGQAIWARYHQTMR
jgi:hypothetical protein